MSLAYFATIATIACDCNSTRTTATPKNSPANRPIGNDNVDLAHLQENLFKAFNEALKMSNEEKKKKDEANTTSAEKFKFDTTSEQKPQEEKSESESERSESESERSESESERSESENEEDEVGKARIKSYFSKCYLKPSEIQYHIEKKQEGQGEMLRKSVMIDPFKGCDESTKKTEKILVKMAFEPIVEKMLLDNSKPSALPIPTIQAYSKILQDESLIKLMTIVYRKEICDTLCKKACQNKSYKVYSSYCKKIGKDQYDLLCTTYQRYLSIAIKKNTPPDKLLTFTNWYPCDKDFSVMFNNIIL